MMKKAFIDFCDKEILETEIKEKYLPSAQRLAHSADLVFCRYNNDTIYLIKDRDGPTGYFSKEEMDKKVNKVVTRKLREKYRCNQNIAIFLTMERKIK